MPQSVTIARLATALEPMKVSRSVVAFEAGREHVLGAEGHPCGAAGCSRWPPVGNGALRSKTPILSSPRNPPSKRFLPSRSLQFTQHPKFEVSLPKTRLRNSRSVLPRATPGRCDRERSCPAMYRRIDVAEAPLANRNLPGRMQENPRQQQVELPLGQVDIDGGERNRVKRQIPGGERQHVKSLRRQAANSGRRQNAWGDRVTTILPRQGQFALAPDAASYPAADLTVERIGDLVDYDLPSCVRQVLQKAGW